LLTSPWKRLALVLVSIPIMLFKNALRISTLALLSIHVDPRIIYVPVRRHSFLHRRAAFVSPILTMLIEMERKRSKRCQWKFPGRYGLASKLTPSSASRCGGWPTSVG
jgi:exosortase/archaeosortase family protein